MVNYMSSGHRDWQANYCHLGRPGQRQNTLPESLFRVSSWGPCFPHYYYQTKPMIEWIEERFTFIFHKNVVMILFQYTIKSVKLTVLEICKLLCKNIVSSAVVDCKTVLCLTPSPVKSSNWYELKKHSLSFSLKQSICWYFKSFDILSHWYFCHFNGLLFNIKNVSLKRWIADIFHCDGPLSFTWDDREKNLCKVCAKLRYSFD